MKGHGGERNLGAASFQEGLSIFFSRSKTFIDAVVITILQERHVHYRKRTVLFQIFLSMKGFL